MENSIESTLDDALNTFVQENDRPTAENLQEWVDRYPNSGRTWSSSPLSGRNSSYCRPLMR